MAHMKKILFIFGACISTISCGPSNADFVEFKRYTSPNLSQVVIVESAHSVLAYGPETVRFFVMVNEKDEKTHVLTTKIANDGGGVTDKNIQAEWLQDNIIKFCLTGDEQQDVIIEIDLGKGSYQKRKEQCSG